MDEDKNKTHKSNNNRAVSMDTLLLKSSPHSRKSHQKGRSSYGIEMFVNMVTDPQILNKYCHIVKRVRRKPMGRYQNWSIEHINRQCEMITITRCTENTLSESAEQASFVRRLQGADVLVIEMVSKHVGRLYDPVGYAPTDVMDHEACIAEVHNVKYNRQTKEYTMNVSPPANKKSTTSSSHASKTLKRFSQLHDTFPLFNTWVFLMLDNGDKIHGKVVYTNDTFVEILIEDSPQKKVWFKLTPHPGTALLERPHIEQYILKTKKHSTYNSAILWEVETSVFDKIIDKVQYTPVSSSLDAEKELQKLLHQVAPVGLTNIFTLTVANTDGLEKLEETEISDIREKASVATLRNVNMVQKGHYAICESEFTFSVNKFPFSITAQIEAFLHKKTSITGEIHVGLQLTPETYISQLYTYETGKHIADDYEKHHVLLPTMNELRSVTMSSTVKSFELNNVHLRVSSDDPSHLSQCVRLFCHDNEQASPSVLQRYQYHRHLRRDVEFVDADITQLRQNNLSMVTLRVDRYDAKYIMHLLTGQVRVDIEEEVDDLQDINPDHEEETHAKHMGYISDHFVYYNVSDCAIWNAQSLTYASFFRPLLQVESNRHALPVPLRHAYHEKAGVVNMPLKKELYFPYYLQTNNDNEDYYVTLNNALPLMDENRTISHKIVSKKMASNRILYDMEQLISPQWFNVMSTDTPYDSIERLLGYMHCSQDQPQSYFIDNQTHITYCNTHAHTEDLFFYKIPSRNKYQTEALESLQEVIFLHESVKRIASDELYGCTINIQSHLSQLSHLLYGSFDQVQNGSKTLFQKKGTKSVNNISGHSIYGTTIKGILALPRFLSHTLTFEHPRLYCSITVNNHEFDIEVWNSKQHALSLQQFCKEMSRVITKTTNIPFRFTYYPRDCSVQIRSIESFTITKPGSLQLLGLHSTCTAKWNPLLKTNVITLHNTKRYKPIKQHAISNVRSEYNVCFSYNVDYLAVGDDNDTSASSCFEFDISYNTQLTIPFEDPLLHKFQTCTGRDGLTKYMSVSIHHQIISLDHYHDTLLVTVPTGMFYIDMHDNSKIEKYDLEPILLSHEHIHSCNLNTETGVLTLYTRIHNNPEAGNRSYQINVDKKETIQDDYSMLVSNHQTEHVWSRVSVLYQYATQVYEVQFVSDTLTGDYRLLLYYVDKQGLTEVQSIPFEQNKTPLVCKLTGEKDIICCHVLDHTSTLHSYTWKNQSVDRNNHVLQLSKFSTFDLILKSHHRKGDINCLCIADNRVYVGFANTRLCLFDIHSSFAKSTIDLNLTHYVSNQSFEWTWKRLLFQPHRSIHVQIKGSKPLENVSSEMCAQSALATDVTHALIQWCGKKGVDTTAITYHMQDYSLHSQMPLCKYLLQNVVGFARHTPSDTFRTMMVQMVDRRETVSFQDKQFVEWYVGGHHVLESLSATHKRVFYELMHMCSQRQHATLESMAPQETHKKNSNISNNRSKPARNKNTKHKKAQRELFYFKMQKLMQSSVGKKYVKELYSSSDVFRHQFHRCKGYCYYKLLYQIKCLSIHGRYVSKKWSDAIRDKYTTNSNGEMYHVCNRCGDNVCKQDSGVRADFGVFGMSLAHGKTDTTDLSVDVSVSYTSEQIERMNNVIAVIQREQLSQHQNVILDLPMTKTVSNGFRMSSNALTLRSIRDVILDDSVYEEKLMKVIRVACIAVQQKINIMTGNLQTIHIPHKQSEQQIIDIWQSHISFSQHQLQRGIEPRKDFRPKLLIKSHSQATTQLQRLFVVLNEQRNDSFGVFDWSSWQSTNDLYERNDLYMSVNRQIVDENSYTTLPHLINDIYDETTITTQALPRLRIAQPIAPRDINVHAIVSVPSFAFAILPKSNKLPLGMFTYRNLNDSRKRTVIYKHVNPSHSNHAMYPHAIQRLVDLNILDQKSHVILLHCLLGITMKQKARMSTNPAMFLNGEWVKYYLQMDVKQPNENVALLLKSLKFSFDHSFETQKLNGMYNKFISS